MRSDMDHTVLPANYTMPAFTPQPQSITALWLVHIYRPTEGRRLSQPVSVFIIFSVYCISVTSHVGGTLNEFRLPITAFYNRTLI